MPASPAAPRWVLGLALGAGLAGVVLKLSDFTGPSEPAPAPPAVESDRPAARAGDTHVPETARSDGHWTDAPGGASSSAAAAHGSDGGTPAGAGATAPRVGRMARTDGTAPDAPRRPRLSRRAARERAAAARNDPSLHVGAAGDSGGETMPERTREGHAAAVPAPAGGTPAEKPAEPAAPEPPAVSDVAFTSGDAGQYATDDPVQVPDVPNFGGGSGSLSFWVQPQWGEGSADDASFLEVADGQLRVVKNVNYLRFEWENQTGIPAGIGVPITEWKPGEWHAVTTTWNGNTYSLYVDGQLVSTKTDLGAVPLPKDATLSIGSNFPESRPVAPGMISRVDARTRPLGPTEVATGFNAATRR